MNKAWRGVVDQLVSEARRRGGTATLDTDMVTLEPPSKSGETIRVTRYSDESGEDQTVIITTGFAFHVGVSLNGEDGPEYVCNKVVAILNGQAMEVVEAAEDGTWLNLVSVIDRMRSTQIAPSDHLKGVPVHHEHRRQIDPWPQWS